MNQEDLKKHVKLADDANILKEFAAIKRKNKERLWQLVKQATGVEFNLDSLFDIQVKRIHEYKRQFLNILYIVYRYLCILKTPWDKRRDTWLPRSFIIGGKAAPGYLTAKRIIKLVNCVADKVNNDSTVNEFLKVVFLPNYNVSSA